MILTKNFSKQNHLFYFWHSINSKNRFVRAIFGTLKVAKLILAETRLPKIVKRVTMASVSLPLELISHVRDAIETTLLVRFGKKHRAFPGVRLEQRPGENFSWGIYVCKNAACYGSTDAIFVPYADQCPDERLT